MPLPPQAPAGVLETVRGNAQWVREFGAPWVQRRLTGRSSGDSIDPKRPDLSPVEPTAPTDRTTKEP